MFTSKFSQRGILSHAILFLLAAVAPVWAAGESDSAAKERELIEALKTKPAAEKAIACKKLAIYGSKDCVPELAKLLADEQLASWSRIALEAIPDPAADEALMQATDKLQGRLLVGTINSIGVREVAKATDLLAGLLKNNDADVASAAAVALGRIGNDDATKTLRQSLATTKGPVLNSVAEGCVLCAERLTADGKTKEAAELYDEVRKADVPKQRILEATRGAIIARGDAGIPLLVEQLKSSDKDLFYIGLSTARELPGGKVGDALAAELPRIEAARAMQLLNALADRPEAVLPRAVYDAAKQGNKELRVAAIGAIGRLGDAESVRALLQIAADSDPQIAQAAVAALAALPDKKVDSRLVDAVSDSDGPVLAVLIQAIGQRRIDATPALVQAVHNSDSEVRHAALTALGETVKPQDLSVLIVQFVDGENPNDVEVAGKALQAAAVRMPDREACAAELSEAMSRGSAEEQSAILEILAAMGGPKALDTIGNAAKSDDPDLQDTATRVLGKWMSVDAAPLLCELAKTPNYQYGGRALRGYIRLARQFEMSDQDRAQVCNNALAAAKRDDDRKLVLEVLQRYPSIDTLKIAVKASKTPGLKQDARNATKQIAEKLGTDKPEVRELLNQAGL